MCKNQLQRYFFLSKSLILVLTKKFQIFAAIHKSNILNSAAKLILSNLSPNLCTYYFSLLLANFETKIRNNPLHNSLLQKVCEYRL